MFDIANVSNSRCEIEIRIISHPILHRYECLQDPLGWRHINKNALNRVTAYLQQNLDILVFILDAVCVQVNTCLNSALIL